MAFRTYSVCDLFAGAGGLSLGFEQAGAYGVVVANEYDDAACDTYAKNRKGVTLVRGDITLPETKDAIVGSFNKKTPCDVVCGGPPCVAHSPAGRRNVRDPRGRLWREYMEIVKRLNPSVCVMENVPGICKARKGEKKPVIEHILKAFEAAGYSAGYRKYVSADFGVPQIRRRVIIVASRDDLPMMPAYETHRGDWVGVMDAIGDLTARDENKAFSHTFPKIGADLVERIGRLKPGESPYGRKDANVRPHGDRPMHSVRATGGGTPSHCTRNGLMSVREMARLQCFPDSYLFTGSRTEQLRQVGNAVPVRLAKAVALSVLPFLEWVEWNRNPKHAKASFREPGKITSNW